MSKKNQPIKERHAVKKTESAPLPQSNGPEAPAAKPERTTEFPVVLCDEETRRLTERDAWTQRLGCVLNDRDRIIRMYNAALEDIAKLRCVISATITGINRLTKDHEKNCQCLLCTKRKSLRDTLSETSGSGLMERALKVDRKSWFASLDIGGTTKDTVGVFFDVSNKIDDEQWQTKIWSQQT